MRRTSAVLTTVLGLGVAATLAPPAAVAAPRCFGERATIVGTSGADVLRGTPRDDVFAALAGDDRIVGLDGDDMVCGGPGADTVDAGDGEDFVLGGRGADRVETGRGADLAVVLAGDSTQTGPGADLVLMLGGENPAVTELGTGPDLFLAETGRGEAQGQGGTDVVALPQDLESETGTPPGVGVITLDRVASYTAPDVEVEVGISQFEQGIGSAGADTLTGDDAANFFDAGPGRDVVSGLGGDDLLVGGAGSDSLDGGEGTDRCPDAGETTVRVDCERPREQAAAAARQAGATRAAYGTVQQGADARLAALLTVLGRSGW